MERIRNKLRSIFEASQEVNPAWKKINKSVADLQKEFPNSDLVKSAQAVVSAQQLHVGEAVKIADEVTARLLDPKKQAPIDLLSSKEEGGFIMHNILLAYRITRRPDKIQEFFTLAWNHPMRGKTDLANQKHIGQQLFGAYIRTNDLAQQRMHASKLFQVFKEERYMFWSLVALALSIPSEGANKQLEIVQHFIEGQLKKDKATSQDLELYLQLLRQQHKHSDVISTVRSDYATKLMPLVHERDLALAHAHTKLQQHEEAMHLYQQLIDTHSADEWQYYTGYLDALMTRVKDVNDTLLTQARDWLAALQSKHSHYRAPYLAHLELESRVLKLFATSQHAVLSALVVEYFKRFSLRPSCWRDLRLYLAALIDTEHVTPCLDKCRAYCTEVKSGLSGVSADDTRALPSHIDWLTRQLNLTALELVAQFNSAHHSPQQLIYSPTALWELWQQAVKLPIKVAPSERHPGDDAATYLAWLVAFAGSHRDDTNTLRTALTLLKRALAVSPHNFEFKYLAVMLYAALGALPAAFTLFKELEIKHMQYDTLSHLVFDRLMDFAAYNEAEHVIAKIIAFHDDNKKTTPEYVLEAYKNGTYAKVGELIAFERRLSHSIQLVKAQQAQLMVSYVKSCNSLSESLHFFADCETLICKDLPHELNDIRALTCNYDATVLFEWDLDVHRVVDPAHPVLTVRNAADDWRVYVQAQYLRVLLHFYLANRAIIKSLAPSPANAKAPSRGARPATPSNESAVLDESHAQSLGTALGTLHRALIEAQVIPADTALHAATPVKSEHAPLAPATHPLRGLTEYTLGTAQFAAQDKLIWSTLLANFDAYLMLNQFIAALSTGGEGVDCAALIGKVKSALTTLKTLLHDAWEKIKQGEKELSKFSVWLRLVNKYLALVLQSSRMSCALLNHTYPARLKKGSDELKAAYIEIKNELKTLSALIETQLTRDLPALLEATKQQLSTLSASAVSELQNPVVDLPDLLHENHKRHVQDACEPILDSYRSIVFQLLDILKFKKN